ncbi:uncharacterized protein Dana_GF26599 [Drosophila ananassae]|uniref:Uncharacterized protein n=1 Tax=Drosophila ananassae TaxID=7217 RepID=A0A0P8ZTT7_DROAN|nr:uncharacterized protein Dana_GF26599 [Drosophila ananassae]
MWRELRQLPASSSLQPPPPPTSLIQQLGACISHRRNEDDSRPKGTAPAQQQARRTKAKRQTRSGSSPAPRHIVI